ncbi:MAG: hypothetical protein JWR15_4191 [Prosthecobacter sp.]|nr:hypothetical protein [Prosthecobacter sp.]
MLYWDVASKKRLEDLERIPHDNRTVFVTEAFTDVVAVLGEGWRAGMKKKIRTAFEVCEQAFLVRQSNDAVLLAKLESLIEEEMYPGVYDLGTALCLALRNRPEMSAKCMRDILGFCYQAVLSVEIESKLECYVLGDQVAELEKQNSACLRVIDLQNGLFARFAL